MVLEIPTYQDVTAARQRLLGHANITPLVRHKRLDEISGVNLYLKNETVQKSGAFKYRGAYSRLSLLSRSERKGGVVAFSSGNHAQGIAIAAKELGIAATIIMPSTAPLKKKQGTLSHGAKIIEYDPSTTDRAELAANIAKQSNAILVPPFDDRFVIAGQGTCAVELLEQCAELGVKLDALITPVGGGGLCAGINLAFEQLSPHTKIYGGEPVNYDDHAKSLRAGKRITNTSAPLSLCDALMSPAPGEITFAINRRLLSGIFPMTDEECLRAMALAKETLDITLEPGGAIALAAALSRPKQLGAGSNVCVVLSGGNVDDQVLKTAEQFSATLPYP